MTRMDSVRAATDSAKESVLHAADVVAPYAGTAKGQAAHYAHEARARLAPRVSSAARQARAQARLRYAAHVAPHVPPRVDVAAHRAAARTRSVAHQVADYTVPRVEHAVAATGPVLEEAGSRSTAAWAALRGQVTPDDVRKIVRKQERRARTGRLVKGLAVLGLLVGGACAAWKWWDRQANPDWLVEPPAPTEVDEGSGMPSASGGAPAVESEASTRVVAESGSVVEAETGSGPGIEPEPDPETGSTEPDERR
ncbi:DUF5324 family protein [Streptomyces roseolus]|uniref:DUF5324 family protein n=1 Tax=Streptomyces roseolus TaxID=67358 RepID=UPI00167AAD4D|nr:DUF5324 family protein [Streptomyces roseolus]GGR70049.1 hypothetical protein GCM10010282_73230 [Streptomyces roseolus]